MRTNAFSVWALWSMTMVAALVAYKFMHPELAAMWVFAGTGILLACSLLPISIYSGLGRWFVDTEELGHRDTLISDSFADRLETPDVDPWKLQRHLMEISDQRMADKPMVTRDVILYFALIMEESFEAGTTLVSALARIREQATPERGEELFTFFTAIMPAVRAMGHASTRVKEMMKAGMLEDWPGAELTLDEAIRLFDDTTDIQVVNSGFCLAAGLPGPTGYLETQHSNISKKNPTTGKIDKTPDGKWIKGVDYKEPDLEQVLIDHFPWLLKDLVEQPIIHPAH